MKIFWNEKDKSDVIAVPNDANVSEYPGYTATEPAESAVNTEQLVRAQRDFFLAEADKLINIAFDNNQDLTLLKEYRQALRNVPNQDGFPISVTWPTKPGDK